MALQPLSQSAAQSGWVAEWLRQPLCQSGWVAEWLLQPICRRHSATLPEWLDQPLSHSATLPERLDQPLSRSEWLSGCVSCSARVAEWLSGWVAAPANLPETLSHSATLPEWLDQPLSHSAREAGTATQPLSRSEWLSGWVAASAALPEWLSGWVAGPASLAEWLSGWVAASISRAVLHIHSNIHNPSLKNQSIENNRKTIEKTGNHMCSIRTPWAPKASPFFTSAPRSTPSASASKSAQSRPAATCRSTSLWHRCRPERRSSRTERSRSQLANRNGTNWFGTEAKTGSTGLVPVFGWLKLWYIHVIHVWSSLEFAYK